MLDPCPAWRLVAAFAVTVWMGVLQAPLAHAADEPGAAGRHDDPLAAEARRHYEEGTKAFNLGEYPRAVTEFKAAYNAKPDPLLLYNIGQSFRLGGDAAQALFFYRSFLRNMPAAQNRKEVEGRIRVLERQVEEQKHETPAAAAATTSPTPVPVAPVSPAVRPAPGDGAPVTPVTPPSTGVTATRRSPETPAGATTSPPALTTPPTLSEPAPPAGPAVDLSQPPTGPQEPYSPPFYKKWWFWTGVGVVLLIGIGAVAARDKVPDTTFGLQNPKFVPPPGM